MLQEQVVVREQREALVVEEALHHRVEQEHQMRVMLAEMEAGVTHIIRQAVGEEVDR